MDKIPYSGVYLDDGIGSKSKDRYRQRRALLLATLKMPIVIMGEQTPPGGINPWAHIFAPVYQDPLFLYLTGINQLGCALLLNPFSKSETLFLPKKDAKKAFWEGFHLGVGNPQSRAEATQITGFQHLQGRRDLDAATHALLNDPAVTQIATFWNESTKGKVLKDVHLASRNRLKKQILNSGRSIKLVNIQETQWKQRLCLDLVDHANAKTAAQKSASAFTELLPQLRRCKSETEVAGQLIGGLLSRSSALSFPPIVAGGQNATVLHYTKNNDLLRSGELLLLDFGVRHHQMHADISRTIPINGTFNPLQKLLYEIVLGAQDLVQSLAKPGIPISELNSACWTHIQAQLKKQVLDRGGIIRLSYKKQPHNVSHLLGHQVHDGDPFRQYRDTPLRVGNMISNEPGVYGYFECKLEGRLWKGQIGIRIEDMLLITSDDCLNLSQDCPKTVKEIEELMSA